MKTIQVSTVKQMAEVEVLYINANLVINVFKAAQYLKMFLSSHKELDCNANAHYYTEVDPIELDQLEETTMTVLDNIVRAFDPEETQEPSKC